MSDISLTLEQDTALFELRTWFVDKLAPFWRLKGFAGTGKTSLMKFLLACDDFRTNKGIAVVAYTHVAAGVLRKKGVHQATTIHSLVYKAVETPNGDFIYDRRPKAEIADMYSLIVVDEASMVAKPMRKDIESFGVPVLYVGDGGQLPPISDDPEDRDFMVNAESQLIEIHRNAGPIAWLAADVRAGKRIEFGKYGDGVFIIRDHELEDEVLLMSDQIIVGKNDTRRDYNRYIRKLKGYKVNNFPAYDERIMVLENMRDLGIYNGMVLTSRQNNNDLHMYKDVGVKHLVLRPDERIIDPEVARMTANMPKVEEMPIELKLYFDKSNPDLQNPQDERYYLRSNKLVKVDYAEAISCHKSQGSSYAKPIVIEEHLSRDRSIHRRWLYTAVTRAEKKLILVRPD